MKCFAMTLLAVALAIPASYRAQTSQAQPSQAQASQAQTRRQEDRVKLGTSEVILDVVVRDKKGHSVKDLKPTDFEIFEDNVRQDISSFRLILREMATRSEKTADGAVPKPPSPAPAPALGREPFSNINLIAMVFDHLSPNARGLALKAATDFVNESLQPDDQVTVCVIDQSLRVLQPYTNDASLLKQAIDRATTAAVSTIDSRSSERRRAEEYRQGFEDRLSGAGSVGGGPGNSGSEAGAAIAVAATDQALLTMKIRALETFEALERNQHGQAQIHGLLAVINSLHNVPGRKAIVLFSEGLALPPDVQVRFPAVINAANRANVSIYAIEAGGLRVESGNAEAAREINAIGNRRARQTASGGTDRSGRPMSMQLERSEDLLKLNPQSGLSDLANGTGGLLIADTNDLSSGLRRIDEDLRSHYVLTYAPKNQTLDGRFRQINVKVTRGGLDVQTRRGYYALPSTGSSPVLDYEAPALAAMGNAAMNNASGNDAFELRSLAFNFPGPGGVGLTSVLAEVPAGAFTYTPNPDKKTYGADFTIISLIKNENGQVIAKLSRRYTLSGPIEQIEAAKRGEILFYREEQLPAGRYIVETAAYDAPSARVRLRSRPLDVQQADNSKLRLSSLVILKRAERLTEQELKQPNPFHYGELLVYPNLGEPMSKAAMKQLPFLFCVYVPRGMKTAPKVAIEVLQRGQHVAHLQPELSAPDPFGRIQFASAIPLDKFEPGSYEMKVTATDGVTSVTRTATFAVAP